MSGETPITIVGNLTADPELRYTNTGIPFATMTIASTPRTFDRQTNEWKDGEALFLRTTAWREFAEHIASSLVKGSRVIARGNLRQRNYQDENGQRRTSIELDLEEIGPSLRYATAEVTRTQSRGQNGGFGAPPAGQNEWGKPSTPNATGGGFGGGFDEEQPF